MADAARAGAVLMTPDEVLVRPLANVQAELVRGELRVTPLAGGPHARVATNIVLLLGAHVMGRGNGQVFANGAGYLLAELPRTVRSPDASFVRANRLPAEGIGPGFLKLAPDLAVEVLSPSESASELDEKLDDYRSCGTPLIWVVDPVRRTVMIIAADSPVQWLRETDMLDGGGVIPGFSCRVVEVFEGIAREQKTD